MKKKDTKACTRKNFYILGTIMLSLTFILLFSTNHIASAAEIARF